MGEGEHLVNEAEAHAEAEAEAEAGTEAGWLAGWLPFPSRSTQVRSADSSCSSNNYLRATAAAADLTVVAGNSGAANWAAS